MATFRPVNTTLVPEPHGRTGEESNPLTPRPNTAPNSQIQAMNRDDATTPTRANFGALASQRPLPTTQTFPSAITNPPTEDAPKTDLNRGNSQYSAKSRESDEMDIGSDGEGEEGSDDDASLNADGTRSKKKTKSQRFYCTDYPPCNLSFTRSEHLARHIRKHTGERPFQCHCSRRFSRLDNLRQHAQTVHQNEDIPPESLAATGTRFQRQVRTDRVRPPGSRNRPATSGGPAGPVRGHHRNSLSASSIGSVNSVYSQREDPRRRPPPLVMAGGEPRARYSQEVYRPESPSSQYPYQAQSPGFSTPTSATLSTGQNSPRWGSGMQSPPTGHSRTQSLYNEHRTPGRRLSVPSAGNPFQSPHGNPYGPPAFGQINASNSGAFSPSGSMLASPTTSTSGSNWSSRRESLSNASDDAWRRRTWHPDSHSQFNSSFTSRLQQVTTPSNYTLYSSAPLPQPPVVPSNAPPPQHPTRLPGIESFGILRRPTSPVRRQPSPMMIDTPSRPPVLQQPDPYQHERPVSQHWDQGINRNMNRLEIQGPPDAASSWANDAHRAVQSQGEHARAQQTVRFEESAYSARPQTSGGIYRQQHASAPPVTPTKAKRMGWYHGPMSVVQPAQTIPYQQPAQRTSPAESSGSEGGIPGTPSSSSAGELNPGIVHSNGWIENRSGNIPPQQEPRPHNPYQYAHPQGAEASYTYTPATQPPAVQHQPQIPKPSDNGMHRLDALVAVATSKDKVTTAY